MYKVPRLLNDYKRGLAQEQRAFISQEDRRFTWRTSCSQCTDPNRVVGMSEVRGSHGAAASSGCALLPCVYDRSEGLVSCHTASLTTLSLPDAALYPSGVVLQGGLLISVPPIRPKAVRHGTRRAGTPRSRSRLTLPRGSFEVLCALTIL